MAPHRAWTDEDDRRLLEMKAAGKPAVVIAKELKRTEASVVSRTTILKVHKPQAEGEGT